MGAAKKLDIVGAKGGSDKPKQPTEAPDSLRSVAVAKMLIAVGEGEFEGTPTARDIYLDSTPLADPAGNLNFPNVKWEWRTGSVEQGHIPGIPSIENEISESVELRSDNAYIRAIDRLELSAIRLRFAWPMLQSVDEGGNVNGYRIEYAVDIATDGGAYQQVLLEAVDGKTTSTYERTRRIELPKATSGWLLRVRRLTPNQNNNKIADTMQIVGRTEVIDAKVRYPNTALLYIEFSAEQFRNIPAVTVDCDARKFQVPSNYDPRTRVYTGVWDGTFKEAWTDNPAWHTYGVTVNDRFGLGRRIKSWQVDKWELYRIAQYCDQLVPNGKGGQEPRFICNLNLQSKADAWSLLRDISAIYRGMTYWAQGQVYSLADMPRDTDFDFAYTRANVIDGKFTYSSASERTRYSRALISYDNPANSYDTDVTSVTDQKLQRRYGDNVLEISAIGCTRESEAQRRGKWALLTNSRDRGITFKVGLDGRIPLPGYVIPVADELLAGRPIGGRIAAVSGRTIGLDRDTQAKAGDRLILNLPDGTCQARTVQSVSGRGVTVTAAYSVEPEPELVWALDADDLAVPLYRVTRVTRPEPGVFEISAVQYDPSKFAHIDTGARLEERPISVIPVTVVPPPASVTLTSNSAINQGIAISTMTITWPAVAGAVAYDVEWRKDNGNWIKLQRTGSTSVDVTGIYAGAYLARVRAVSAFDISSIWKSSNLTQLTGKVGLPPAVSFLTTAALVYGIGLSWGFPAGAEDTERTEIWYSKTNSRNDAIKLGDFAYPQAKHELHGLAAGVSFFFWARLIDRTGNVGPWYPAGVGVNGQSSADQSEYEEYFKDKITEGALYPALQERIDLIDGPPSLPGSVSQRVEEVKVQVEEINDQLGEQISQVQGNLQQQIDQVSAIAKSAEYQKEKAYTAGASTRLNDRLYQAKIAVPADLTGAKAPPNTTYWLDVGQVVSQSNGLAGRVTTVETKVTEQDGKLTAQSERIDGVQSSLTVTNGNVTAAQNAAQAAADLAGGKGKVLTQSATPAAADRLAQNLWIDTTGGANTPKRWNGSAWVAVSDKVATDAAAAAANALSVANTKADASAVDNISSRVTAAEGTITSQGQALTGLNNSLTTTNQNVMAAQQAADSANALAGGKGKVIIQSAAPAAADRLVQNLWIDTTGNANTPKRWTGSAWAAVTDKAATDAAAAAASALAQVATKAEASTVQALSNEVTQQGQTITAQGQAITNVQASVGNIAGNGSNLMPAEYSVFSDTAPALVLGGGQFASVVADPTAFNGYALRLLKTSGTGTTYFAPSAIYSGANIALKNKKYIASFNARSEGANKEMVASLRTISSSGEVRFAPGQNIAITGNWARYNVLFDVSSPLFVADKMVLTLSASPNPADGIAVFVDRIMLEEQIGTGTDPSAFVIGNSAGQVAANAAATTAINARVTQTETGLTSQGAAITGLNNGLTATNQGVTAAQQAADAAATLAGSKGKVLVQTATPAVADRLAQNLWIDITGNANTPKRWNGSAWVTVSDKVATDAAAAAANALAVAQTKADASTVQALTNTVSQQGNTITAQGTELTNIKATVGSVAGENLLLDPTFSNSNGIGQAGTVLVRNDAAVPGGASSARVVRVSPATGTGNTYYAFLSALNVRPPENGNSAQIAVVGGEVYDFELYAYVAAARGQCGLWIQFYDAAGLSIGHNWVLAAGDGERVTTTTGGWVKLTGMATVPAAAIRMAMTLRVGAGNATDVFMSAPAARKRSGQDNAQASALQSVDARVSVTEGEVSSQGSAITQLNNTVAGKADNSALQSLQSTVSQQGNTLNSQGQAVTQLQSTVGGIGGAGTNLIPAEYSSFTETLPAIQKRNTTTVTAEAFSAAYGTHRLKVSDSTTDGNGYFCLYANNEMLNLRLKPSTKYIFSAWVQSGAAARTVRLRHRYVNAAGSQVEAHLANLTLTTEWGRISASFTTPAALVDRAELLIFTTPAAGSQDSWWDGFMIEEQIGANVTPSSFAPGTSTYQAAGQATAISQLNTTVNQQGTAITAHATRLDGLYAQVSPEMEGDSSGLAGEVGSLVGVWTEQSARIEDGIATGRRVDTVQSQIGDVEGSVQAVSASVQQVTETIAGVDGRVSAMTTIKAETISGGRRVMAGLALGSDGQTSEILAFAQRFAIVDESSGNMTLPFVVQGGQVFISQAIINQAFIKEIVAGMSIRSSAVNSQGLPLLEINFASGTFTLRGQDANGSTLLNNGGLYVYDANGVERTAVGRMS